MTTIIFVFFIAFLLSLLLTPIVLRVANRFNIVDVPKDRKVHDRPIPRLGGVAMFFAFMVSLALLALNREMFLDVAGKEPRLPLFLVGLTAAFLLGLWDDIRRLSSGTKFLGQLLIGVFSFYAGINVTLVSIPFIGSISLGYLALPVTVFWFLLVINAINLIDGLDGLASGICLFVSITIMVVCLLENKLVEAIGFAALGGALIGFLRYNFNPASIFMGDGGSYFLGYFIAALSILGAIKSQVATAILIPVIALGVPLIDTLFAPVRRFALGRKMFQPDKSHLHHRMLAMGYSQRRAVLIIYGFTIILGIASIVIIHAQDEVVALILIVLGMGIIFLGRFFGIMEYFTMKRIGRWLQDISYETGISHERRHFLNHQMAIAHAKDINHFWGEVCNTLQYLEFDFAELSLISKPGSTSADSENERVQKDRDSQVNYTWSRNGAKAADLLGKQGMLIIEQPLMGSDDTLKQHGTLFLVKDIREQGIGHYSLKRLEHLRRAMGAKLDDFH